MLASKLNTRKASATPHRSFEVAWYSPQIRLIVLIAASMLNKKRPKEVVGNNEDRVFGSVTREDHRTLSRLIRFMRNAIEPGQVEHIVGRRCHDAIQAAHLHGAEQAIKIAKSPGQRRASERRRVS
jgi:hypothetical protein